MNCEEAQDIILHSNPKELHKTKEGQQKGKDACIHILKCIRCLLFLSKHTEELYQMQKAVHDNKTETI